MRISLILFLLAGFVIFWVQTVSASANATNYQYNNKILLTKNIEIPSYFAYTEYEASKATPLSKVIPQDTYLQKEETKEEILADRNSFTINASAYTASADECGNSKGITASGERVQTNHTLACPPHYAFGTKIAIDGYGTFTCKDRGGAIKGNHFDIYMETKAEAFAFGRRTLTAYVIS